MGRALLRTRPATATPQRAFSAACAARQVASLAPATHAYSFWEGIPEAAKRAFGRLFAAAPDLRGVAVVQRAMRGREPAAVMAELGFGALELVGSFAVSMSGAPARRVRGAPALAARQSRLRPLTRPGFESQPALPAWRPPPHSTSAVCVSAATIAVGSPRPGGAWQQACSDLS